MRFSLMMALASLPGFPALHWACSCFVGNAHRGWSDEGILELPSPVVIDSSLTSGRFIRQVIPTTAVRHDHFETNIVLSGSVCGPLINAYLVQEQNWRWMCYFLAVAAGVVFLAGIFTIRETSYCKQREREPGRKRSRWQWMSLTVGFNRDASFLQALLEILAMLPMTDQTMNIIVQLPSFRTFLKPPYNWELGDLSLLSLSGVIGSILAFHVGGRLIDIITTRSTARHAGARMEQGPAPVFGEMTAI